MFITDARHSAEALDRGDRIPGPARKLAAFIESITLTASILRAKDICETSDSCRRKLTHRARPGHIHAAYTCNSTVNHTR